MGRFLLLLPFTIFLAGLTAADGRAPKLLVLIVVDQLRADYLTRFDTHWRSGFRKLLDEGAAFERAQYPYMNTATCPGHATIATGAFPRTHGMVGNGWWHADERRTLECVDDSAARDISYGGGRPTGGHSARKLLTPTMGDELRAQRPGARIVTLSLKDRSAIALAGRSADAVTWFEPETRSFATSRAFTAHPVKVVRDFVRRDAPEKDLGRAWTLALAADAYRQRDAAIGERPPPSWTGRFPHLLTGIKGADDRFFALWQTSPFADAYLGRMAAAMIDGFGLGQQTSTDFLGVGFSSLDAVGHTFGPDSREVEDLLIRLDQTLGALIDHLDARVGRDNYVLALSADHGVAPIAIPGSSVGRIAGEDVRERIEEVLTTHFGPLQKGTYVTAIGGMNVHLAPGIYERTTTTPAVWQALEQALLDIPGVSRVLRRDLLSATSSDPIIRAAALSHMRGRSGDLLVIPKPYWVFFGRNATNAATHGTSYQYDIHVPIIFFGSGIRAGRFADEATPADIAPTLATLTGLRMPHAEGHVLHSALDGVVSTK
jgi:predicted AlkP superfamily pyrophosphatase or phosphodiesterase